MTTDLTIAITNSGSSAAFLRLDSADHTRHDRLPGAE
jgi:hypothetical protein